MALPAPTRSDIMRTTSTCLGAILALSLTIVAAPTMAADATTPSATAADDAPSLLTLQRFVTDKLDYDLDYFGRVKKAHEQGRMLPGIAKTGWGAEVTRATRNLPVLLRYAEEKRAGAMFTLPPATSHREYRNLLTLLNMMQAHRAGQPKEVLARAAAVSLKRPDDLGRVRGGGADYYVALYRAWFYLVGSAHYTLGNDDKAIEWFARLKGDTTLASLKNQQDDDTAASADDTGPDLAALRRRSVAILPFDDNTGDAALRWIGPGLLEVLSVDLAQSSDLTLVERAQLEKVVGETALRTGGFTGSGEAEKVGAMLGAGTLVVGAVQKQGTDLLLTARLVAVDGERVLAAAQEATPADAVFPAARKLLLKLLSTVGWDDALLADDFLARHAPAPQTAKALHEARLLRATNQDQARALYAKAMQEDPALANLYGDLRAQFGDLSATLGVTPFVNIVGTEADAWMVRGVLEALSTDLPKVGFTVVERARLEELFAARAEADGTFVDAKKASEIGAALGADFMVLGGILHQSPSIRIDLRVVDVDTGVIAFSTTAENRRDDLASAITSLTTQIAERFNRPLDDKTIDELLAQKMEPAEFEKAMREQLAKDRLRPKASVAAPPPPFDPRPLLVWSGVGGVVVGGAVAATGLALRNPLAERAHELHGLQLLVSNVDERDALRAERDAAAAEANLWTGLAVGGAGLAAVGLGLVATGALLSPPDETATSEVR
jgi:TolB-like protein